MKNVIISLNVVRHILFTCTLFRGTLMTLAFAAINLIFYSFATCTQRHTKSDHIKAL